MGYDMKKISAIVALCLLATFISCSSGSTRNIAKEKANSYVVLFAWSEDTTRTWEFSLKHDRSFTYCISLPVGQDRVTCYEGKVAGNMHSDTIFLTYVKGGKPGVLKPYLIREISGNYLVQRFSDDSRRVLMRIYNRIR